MSLLVLAYGGGTNSTALIVGLWERGMRPDLILFADTGGEKPNTYEHVRGVSDWLICRGWPSIITVTKGGRQETLEENCLRKNMLPSIAYGFKSCSHKYKKEPQEQYINNWQPTREVWKRGERVIKLIGYDADETRRAHINDDDKYHYEYPLIDWGWGREECVEAIQRAGLPLPGKSACFFCPSNKKHEIATLQKEYPNLLARALAMEANAELTTIKGLGRSFSWKDFVNGDAPARKKSPESRVEMACDCYDGDGSDLV